MKEWKVISTGNLPLRMPIWPTLIVWLMLRELGAGDLERGIVYAVVGVWWVVWILSWSLAEYVDIFKPEKEQP